MLIGIGDETAIDSAVNDYHEKRLAWIAMKEMVEVGQPLGIEHLAVDLTSDTFLAPKDGLPSGEQKRHDSAWYMVLLVTNSAWFSDDVRESAKELNGIALTREDEFVRKVTDWWIENQNRIRSGDYDAVSPFATPEGNFAMTQPPRQTAGERASAGETERPVNREPPRHSEVTSSNAKRLWIYYSVGGLLLVGMIVVLAVKERRR